MDDRWQTFFEAFPETVTTEQLPVKLPRFDLDLPELAGAAADWCQQYLKDRKCPSDLIVFLTQRIINNLRVKWTVEPEKFGYRNEKQDYQALWLMRRVIEELNDVCLNHTTVVPYHQPILTSVWWSSFTLKNNRRQMEDYIAVIPYLHTLFDVKDYGEASFYAVYDGHNGLDAAVYSSMYLHQFLVQSVHYPTDPKCALFESFFTTDKCFAQKTEKYNLVSGTTAVCALHRPQEKKLYVGWVGDSIATLWKNGTPLCLINKHTPNRYDENQRITNAGGLVSKCQGVWRVDGQLSVSRAIGDIKYKPHIICTPELRVLVLDGNEEFLVLGSDGLWDNTTPEDIAETIYDELLETDGDVSQVSNKLVFKSKENGSKDNISVITIFLQDPKQLVANRRAVVMETAMEQRNASATLASYGQDAGDFGPETDVDTPDEQIGSTKPKVEGDANVIDESGEDSEEDGGGWNYYNKSATEVTEKKTYQEDNNTGNNSDTEDMDYKLNPDAPEFVPVSSPPVSTVNLAQHILGASDDFISSSPQKYTESIENVDVPDENDFNNAIKVHAADLSKFDNLNEPNDDSTMLNGIKPLSEEVTDHVETIDNFIFQNEHITNGNLEKYQNPFVPDEKVDLNKVQDLSEYMNDGDQTFNTDPYVSLMETPKSNEFNSTSNNSELQSESDVKLCDDFSMGEHMKYEQEMNSKNIDDTINITNSTVDSTPQLNDEFFKHGDDFKNEFMDNSHIGKFGQYEDHKLNDSVSTTDAILGSEPNTPMRMDNQSTFESENDDDQFSESFKQQLQFNQFDEHNDKENHDPFCFEQTDDPAGIIPNVTHEVNEDIDELHNNDIVKPDDSSNENQVPELIKHEPVEEPLCVREVAKPFHSVYEQQYLPESDFSASTHEALLNTTENESYNHQNDVNNTHFEHEILESKEEEIIKHQNVGEGESKLPSSTNYVEQDDSDLDEVKYHAESLNREFDYNNTYTEQENSSTQNENLVSEHNIKDDFKQENHADDDCIQNHVDNLESHQDFETLEVKHTEDPILEHNNVAEIVQDYVAEPKKENDNITGFQNHADDFQRENHSYDAEIIPNNAENPSNGDFNVNHFVETAQSHINEVEQEYNEVIKNYNDNFDQDQHNVLEEKNNLVEDFKQEHHDIVEIENNHVDDFKQDYRNVVEIENNHIEDFKQNCDDIVEVENNHVDDFKQDHHNVEETNNEHVEDFKQEHHTVGEVENNHFGDYKQKYDDVAEITEKHIENVQKEQHEIESVQNHTIDSDEEMHSSMIIHSDVENNMPQPYCSAQDTLVNEPDMMCTSMTFEENFQNRNMSDSLYVMETSSDYFGEDIQPTTQLEKTIDEPKVEEQSTNYNQLAEPINTENEITTEAKSELVSESKVEEVKVETIEPTQLTSQDPIEKQGESNKVSEIAVAAAVGTAAIAAVTGACLASKKSTSKKIETTVSKAKSTTVKTPPAKPLVSKTSAPILKKSTLSTTSKPLSRPTTAPSTTKSAVNVRPATVQKTTTLKATTVTKAPAPKPAPKATIPASRPTSTKTTVTTPRSSLTKTTPTSSPKTPTTPKTPLATKSATTQRTSTTPRTSLVSKQPLSNGSPKPLSRPISAPMKKPLSSVATNGNTKLTNGITKLTNGTAKLTNGDVSKTSTTTKPPITLATRMSLAPPKLPPKVKVAAPKTETPPAMPGPIRRPKAPTTKKTETASS